jgi:hypothetical protein
MRLVKGGEFRINIDEINYTHFDGLSWWIYFKNKEYAEMNPAEFKELLDNITRMEAP